MYYLSSGRPDDHRLEVEGRRHTNTMRWVRPLPSRLVLPAGKRLNRHVLSLPTWEASMLRPRGLRNQDIDHFTSVSVSTHGAH